MQKGKITDYESFQNEITILMNLVSELPESLTSGCVRPSTVFWSVLTSARYPSVKELVKLVEAQPLPLSVEWTSMFTYYFNTIGPSKHHQAPRDLGDWPHLLPRYWVRTFYNYRIIPSHSLTSISLSILTPLIILVDSAKVANFSSTSPRRSTWLKLRLLSSCARLSTLYAISTTTRSATGKS